MFNRIVLVGNLTKDIELRYTQGGAAIGSCGIAETRKFDAIITNPPFSLAKEFILKACEVAPRFAFLLPLNYLHGKERLDEIYSREILEKVYVFARYPLLSAQIRPDGKYETGMMVYAWYIFDTRHKGAPTIRWIDNDSDVARRGK